MTNQVSEKLLTQKAKESGLSNTRNYVDDGYTGTNFNRPGFQQLSHKYEAERLELKTKITELRKRLAEMGSRQQDRDNFIDAIRQFAEMTNLTAPLLRELIDHIDVFETEGTGKSRTQRIVIHYRFVGRIELPGNYSRENCKADFRPGVAVEYLPAVPHNAKGAGRVPAPM